MTTSYARHTAADRLVDTVSNLGDKFIETYIGKYGRPKYFYSNLNTRVMNDNEIIVYFKECVSFLTASMDVIGVRETDTDLLNIRDELLSEINKTLYLFTLS